MAHFSLSALLIHTIFAAGTAPAAQLLSSSRGLWACAPGAVGRAGCSAGEPLGVCGVHKGARRSAWAGGTTCLGRSALGARGALRVPAAGAPAGFPEQGGEQKEARGPLRPAGPGCHLDRGRSHLRLWLAQEAGTRGGDARPRAFGGWPERCLRGLEDWEVAADAAAATENTRSPNSGVPGGGRLTLRTRRCTGEGAQPLPPALQPVSCGNALAPPRSASAGRGRSCSLGPERCGGASPRVWGPWGQEWEERTLVL